MQKINSFIKIYPNVISTELCEYFINFFEKENKLGNTYSGVIGTDIDKKSFKDSEDLNIRYNQKINKNYIDSKEHLKNYQSYKKVVFEKFSEYLREYNPVGLDTAYSYLLNNKLPIFCEPEISGGPLIHKYEPPNQGYHTWHSDWSSSVRSGHHEISNRMLVGMVYLNTVDEGGETEFYYQKIKIKPEQGKLVVFPTYFTHLHRGNKPISNTKYIINMWGIPIA